MFIYTAYQAIGVCGSKHITSDTLLREAMIASYKDTITMNVSLRVRATTRWSLKAVHFPIEVSIAMLFGSIWLVGVIAGLPMSLPGFDQLPLLQVHFVGPILCATLGQLILLVAMSFGVGREKPRVADPYVMLKLFPLVLLSVFLYFNFKAWMPLVNTRLYDPFFARIDRAAAPLLSLMLVARTAIATHMPVDVDIWYMLLFYAMFFCSFSVHSIVDAPYRQRQLVLGMCLNLLIGGLSYWIAPAEGPFLYHAGPNQGATNLQQLMHEMFLQVRATGVLPSGYFLLPLGAMPSLHMAHTLLFVLYAARSARFLLILYVPLLCWVILEACSSGWHYLVDLPAGALLALLSFVLAQRLISRPADSII